MKILSVRELIDILAHYPDDVPVVMTEEDSGEYGEIDDHHLILEQIFREEGKEISAADTH